MTRRRIPRDPTARTATTNALNFGPAEWGQVEMIIRLIALMDLPDAEINRQTGMPRYALLQAMGADRPLFQDPLTRNELVELADGLSPTLKAAVERAAQEVELSMMRPCERCGQVTVPPQRRAGGRPRRFCSNACRQANHRQQVQDRKTGGPLSR